MFFRLFLCSFVFSFFFFLGGGCWWFMVLRFWGLGLGFRVCMGCHCLDVFFGGRGAGRGIYYQRLPCLTICFCFHMLSYALMTSHEQVNSHIWFAHRL